MSHAHSIGQESPLELLDHHLYGHDDTPRWVFIDKSGKLVVAIPIEKLKNNLKSSEILALVSLTAQRLKKSDDVSKMLSHGLTMDFLKKIKKEENDSILEIDYDHLYVAGIGKMTLSEFSKWQHEIIDDTTRAPMRAYLLLFDSYSLVNQTDIRRLRQLRLIHNASS